VAVPPLVTLLVPTVHHRAALFARTLRYLDGIGFPGPIVVSDHSPEGHAGPIAQAAAAHPRLDLKLLRHAPETHFLTRLAHCAAEAATPYVHLHADDDFVVPGALDRLVDVMQGDSSCSAAMGVNMHVDFGAGQVTVLSKQALSQAAAFERLASQLESYSSVLYALRRRDELIETFGFAAERCPDVQFWQYLESCVVALRGPVAVMEELHYVRAQHDRKWSATLVRERSPDHLPYLLLSPAFGERLAAFRAALVEACDGVGAPIDAARLESGLLHLLHRGLGAMGLPPRTAQPSSSPEAAAKSMLTRVQNLQDPAGAALHRIFSLAQS
jgi:glycosyltransferase domain-containing protein